MAKYQLDANGEPLLDSNGERIPETDTTVNMAPAPKPSFEDVKNKALTAGYSGLNDVEKAIFNSAYPDSRIAKFHNLSLQEVQDLVDMKAQGAGTRDIAAQTAQTGDLNAQPWYQPIMPATAANEKQKAVAEYLGAPDPGNTLGAVLSDVASMGGRAVKGVLGGLGGGISAGLNKGVHNIEDKADFTSGILPEVAKGAMEGFQRNFSNPTGMLGSPSSAMFALPVAQGWKVGESLLAQITEATEGLSGVRNAAAIPGAAIQSALNTPGSLFAQGISRVAPNLPSAIPGAVEGAVSGATNTMAANAVDNMGSSAPLTQGIVPSMIMGPVMGIAGKAGASLGLHWTPSVRDFVEREASKNPNNLVQGRERALGNVASVIDEANRHSWFPTGSDVAAVGQRAGSRAHDAYETIDKVIAPVSTEMRGTRGNIEFNPKSEDYGHAKPLKAPGNADVERAMGQYPKGSVEHSRALITLAQSGHVPPENLDAAMRDPDLPKHVREELYKLKTLGNDRVPGTEQMVWVPGEGHTMEDVHNALEHLRTLSPFDPSPILDNAQLAVRGSGPYKDLPAAETRDLFLVGQRKMHDQRSTNAHTYAAKPKELDKALEEKFRSAPTYFAPGDLRHAYAPGEHGNPMLWSDMSALRKPFNLHQGTKMRFGAANMQSDINNVGGDVVSKYMYNQNKSIADAGLAPVAEAARQEWARKRLVEGLGEEAYKRHVGRIPTAAEVLQENAPIGWRYTMPMLLRKSGQALSGGQGAALGAGIRGQGGK